VLPSTFLSTRHPPPPEGWGPRRHLRSVPADGIISVVMHVHGLSGYFRTIDLCVRCRSLLAFTEYEPVHAETGTEPQVEARPRPDAWMGERERDKKADSGVPTIPWEEWGPKNTRIMEHDSHTWGSLVGERRATVGQVRPVRITMRDYNPFRVRRALARTGGAGNEIKLECGSVMRVVDDMSTYRGGEWFIDDIESSLPYVETVTPYPGCEGVFMDEDNLLAEVRTEAGERKFLLHSL